MSVTTTRTTSRPAVPQRIMLAHGGGGSLTDELIRTRILPVLGNDVLNRLTDSAVLEIGRTKLAMTTDGYVVQPLEFPGGDIGRLAVCGTVNDLAMAGAVPIALSLAMVLEEGLDGALLQRVLASIADAADQANVQIVTGDTKVVERHRAEGMYITTAGIGQVIDGVSLSYEAIRSGDAILVNGSIAEHGLAVMSKRKDLAFASELISDVAPLADLANRLAREVDGVRMLRDATRGGLAGVLADLASGSRLSVEVDQAAVPITPTAQAAADLLGFDPLTVANEGKFVAVVAADSADKALALCAEHEFGRSAAVIGRMTDQAPAIAELVTPIGGRRVVQKPYGEDLPRIC